jgi:hypothetical protein
MTEDSASAGMITRLDNAFEARSDQIFEHDQDVVWCMLTESQEFCQWLAPSFIRLRFTVPPACTETQR